MLILVVGPSGAGKDSLLNAARKDFQSDPRIHFARRVITRPRDPGAEDHEPVSETEFATRDFALSWRAHGLRYGIPSQAPGTAPFVVANVSRGAIVDAARRFDVRVIEITAPPEILARRLRARGREGAEDVARRLTRKVEIPATVAVRTVTNDATPREGVDRFVAALREILEEWTATPSV
jgi:phosphonate metabolism protein PhnN/1,5-bisphosphokinase (PRPP-forming)